MKCTAGLTDVFQVTVRLHQGSALNPLLFAIVMDCLIREIQICAMGHVVCRRRGVVWRVAGGSEDKAGNLEKSYGR